MDGSKSTVIDVVEAAYNLETQASEWLPNVLRAARPMLDVGFAYGGSTWAGRSHDGAPFVTRAVLGHGPSDLPLKMLGAAQELGVEAVRRDTDTIIGTVRLLSESPEHVREAIGRHTGCTDSLDVCAVDPDFHGVTLNALSHEPISLTARQREVWFMLLVHLAAGHRLRRAISEPPDVSAATLTDLPHNAEALVDPHGFAVSQAAGGARDRNASKIIRDAAVKVDRARSKLRRSDPHEALRIWNGLVRGRWSLVDWFDSDGRRFVIAKPNAPHLKDPRGLTSQEHLVATYAARGESSKAIGYRLGLSAARVSALRRDAMHKLGAKTQAQLIERMRGLPHGDTIH